MNLSTLLLTPWRAGRPAMRWLVLFLVVLAVLGAFAVGMYVHQADWWVGALVCLGGGLGFLWGFVLSCLALLAVDARQLRLPGVQRSVTGALLLYGLSSVGLPSGLLGLYAGHTPTIALALTLCGLCGMLFVLLPRYLGSMIGFVPMLLQILSADFHLPGPAQAGFVHWALPTMLLAALIVAFCWWRLLRAERPYETGLSRPMLVQFRNSCGGNGWTGFAGNGMDSTAQIRSRPDWMQPRTDLRHCGPGHAVRSLRVALGGLFLPLTPMGRLRQLAFLLVPSLLFIALISAQGMRRHGEAFWHSGGLFMLIWFGAFGSSMLALFFLMPLQQRWQKANAELPLLALMPGLTADRQTKRDLLRAVFALPMAAQAALLLVLLGLGAVLGLGMPSLLLLTLAQLGGIGFMLAFALATVGGRPLRHGATAALSVYGYVLICVSVFLPALAENGRFHLDTSWSALFAAGWATLIVLLLWLGRRGWRGLQLRPHPFLPN